MPAAVLPSRPMETTPSASPRAPSLHWVCSPGGGGALIQFPETPLALPAEQMATLPRLLISKGQLCSPRGSNTEDSRPQSEHGPRSAEGQQRLSVLRDFQASPTALEDPWDPNLPEGGLLCVLLAKGEGV